MAPPKHRRQIIKDDNRCAIVPGTKNIQYYDVVGDATQRSAWKKTLSGTKTAMARKFPKFGELPMELQVKIWTWYGRINADIPNVIQVYNHIIRYKVEGPLPRGITKRAYLSHNVEVQKVAYKIPPILLVCVASREAGQKLYKEEYQMIPMGTNDKQLTHYNEDKDIIYILNLFTFQDWRYNRQTDFERRTRTQNPQAALEPIKRRINMKHLVIGCRMQNNFMWKLLGRFYDCETIILEAFDKTDSVDFSESISFKDDRETYIRDRDKLCGYWKTEREGPFVREDYEGKPIRPVVATPSWDPTEPTISNPILLFRTWNWSRVGEFRRDLEKEHPAIRQKPHICKNSSEVTFPNDFKYSPLHTWQYDQPWRTYIG